MTLEMKLVVIGLIIGVIALLIGLVALLISLLESFFPGWGVKLRDKRFTKRRRKSSEDSRRRLLKLQRKLANITSDDYLERMQALAQVLICVSIFLIAVGLVMQHLAATTLTTVTAEKALFHRTAQFVYAVSGISYEWAAVSAVYAAWVFWNSHRFAVEKQRTRWEAEISSIERELEADRPPK